jgi:putative sigma-54 modulation protein
MELTVKSRNGKLSERQQAHIEEKLRKLDRYLDGITDIHVDVRQEMNRDAGEVYRVQATLTGLNGVLLRAEERSADLYAAIDEVQSVLQRQIRRYKDKYWHRARRDRQIAAEAAAHAAVVPAPGNEPVTADDVLAEAEEAPQRDILRSKAFKLQPLHVDDAIERMELLGHSFFVFQDIGDGRISIVYRRRDGNYGVILPQV